MARLLWPNAAMIRTALIVRTGIVFRIDREGSPTDRAVRHQGIDEGGIEAEQVA